MATTGWIWKVYVFGGIALWIAAIFLVSSRYEPADQDQPVRLTAAIGGAVFFAGIFLISFLQLRTTSSRQASGLYERLAVAPIPDGASAPGRSMRGVAIVYLVFGVVVTVGGLAAIALGGDAARWVLYGVVGVVVIWVVYLFLVAWRRAFSSANDAVTPLGLQLVAEPSYTPNPVGGGGQLVGAVVYEGVRHGRAVRIEQRAKEAVTTIQLPSAPGAPAGWRAPVAVPRSPEQMAVATGEPPATWRKVSVDAGGGAVIVRRRANGAGGWMLADLLLAETVAGGRP